MAEGIIKWFSDQKGYGFIEQVEGPDVFVHFSAVKVAVQGDYRTLSEGDRVEFETEEDERGPKAINVIVLEKAEKKGA